MSNAFIADDAMLRKLRICMKNNWNVLFIGKHGCGKTSIIKALWESMDLKYRIFSASTMDPWVDFIGIPKESEDKEGKFLEFVRKRGLDQYEAFCFDEYNRAHKKIRNAVMEMIQFKSINDEKLGNLKVVWAAINPDDDDDLGGKTYDVERLDPAQKDRFQVQIHVPYKPVKSYFAFKYGEEVADTAIKWWENLNTTEKEKEKNKTIKDLRDLVSPRRLDYALEIFFAGGPVEDVLPPEIGSSSFKKVIKGKPLFSELVRLYTDNNKEDARKFLLDENTYDQVKTEILKDMDKIKFFVPLLPKERINSLISSDSTISSWAMKEYEKYPEIEQSLNEIKDAGTNKVLSQQIIKRFDMDKTKKAGQINSKPAINEDHIEPAYKLETDDGNFDKTLSNLKNQELHSTIKRNDACKTLSLSMPKKMSLAQSCESLSILDKIVEFSHLDSMEDRFQNFMGLVNNCVENMYNLNYDFTQFKTEYPNILKYAVKFKGFYFNLVVKNNG